MVTDLVGVTPLLLYFGSRNPDPRGLLSANSAGLTQVFIHNLQPRQLEKAPHSQSAHLPQRSPASVHAGRGPPAADGADTQILASSQTGLIVKHATREKHTKFRSSQIHGATIAAVLEMLSEMLKFPLF